ncbi:MAG: hypothetical protein WAZ12_03830 [Candidatus Absconditicoccaceae bacterium]
MKVVYPKNIKKGLLSGMSFQIGPLTISVIQLFILAIGVAISLTLFNAASKSGSKAFGIIIALIVLIIFIIIAFFKVSELGLLAFIAKLLRNNIFDATKKYQNDYPRNDKIEIEIKELKEGKQTQKIDYKLDKNFDKKKIEDIEKSGLI